jgi:hypothetical protein
LTLAYNLGIDGGGSETYALLSDEHGHVLGKGRSGNGTTRPVYETNHLVGFSPVNPSKFHHLRYLVGNTPSIPKKV